jgi:hypothetical protein
MYNINTLIITGKVYKHIIYKLVYDVTILKKFLQN